MTRRYSSISPILAFWALRREQAPSLTFDHSRIIGRPCLRLQGARTASMVERRAYFSDERIVTHPKTTRPGAAHGWTPYKPSTLRLSMENAPKPSVLHLFSEWLLRPERFPAPQRAVRNRYRMGRHSTAVTNFGDRRLRSRVSAMSRWNSGGAAPVPAI